MVVFFTIFTKKSALLRDAYDVMQKPKDMFLSFSIPFPEQSVLIQDFIDLLCSQLERLIIYDKHIRIWWSFSASTYPPSQYVLMPLVSLNKYYTCTT